MSVGVVVGCDRSQRWLFPWWWKHYSRHNSYPVKFVDFDALENKESSPLFKKPLAILRSPFALTLWLDLDCQVMGSLEPLFHSLVFGDIGLVQEGDSIRQHDAEKGLLLPGEVNYNTGVIAVRKNAKILQQWVDLAKKDLFLDDQYALVRAVFLYQPALVDLPPIYNWPNEYGPNEQAIIRHFDGIHGKLDILHSLSGVVSI